MKQEPVWMKEIRQQMKKTRFYGKMEKELERYKTEYLKTLETLDTEKANSIKQYVEQVEKCEFQHIRIAYLEGMETEKANQRARKNDFYQLVTENNMLKTAVVVRTADYLLSNPEYIKQQDAFDELKQQYNALLRTLPEEQRTLIKTYHQGLVDVYDVMYHIAAGFPRGFL